MDSALVTVHVRIADPDGEEQLARILIYHRVERLCECLGQVIVPRVRLDDRDHALLVLECVKPVKDLLGGDLGLAEDQLLRAP